MEPLAADAAEEERLLESAMAKELNMLRELAVEKLLALDTAEDPAPLMDQA